MGSAGETNLNIYGAVFVLAIGILIFGLPRKYVLIGVFASAGLMTLGQNVNIMGLDFYGIRIVIFLGWVRALVVKRDISFSGFNYLDKLIVVWVCYSIFSYSFLYGSFEAFINRLGLAYNVVGSYFLFRFYIGDIWEIESSLELYNFVVILVGGFVFVEYFTGRNVFSVFGGVPEFTTTLGDGRLRCRGAFGHPILAGTFGSISVPISIGLWLKDRSRMLGLLGLMMGSFIVFASGSTGPLLAFLVGLIGMGMWPFRGMMRIVRYGVLFGVVSLHMIMEAPVWYVMARISHSIGGHGYHRSELINQAINHIGEWWLIGTKNNAHWMPFAVLPTSPELVDATNQFISEGVSGGILKMILFIAIIAVSFGGVGRWIRENEAKPFTTKILVWSVGSVLLTHTVSFLSISYFDQMVVFWSLCLAFAGAIIESNLRDNQA